MGAHQRGRLIREGGFSERLFIRGAYQRGRHIREGGLVERVLIGGGLLREVGLSERKAK